MADAFCFACREGGLETVRRLLAEGVSPGSVDSDGRPALVCAALDGRAAVVELLLGAGAGVDVRGSDGWTALMYAAFGGRLDVVRLLLRGGADPALEDEDGKDALAWAKRQGEADVAALLATPAEERQQDVRARLADARARVEPAAGALPASEGLELRRWLLSDQHRAFWLAHMPDEMQEVLRLIGLPVLELPEAEGEKQRTALMIVLAQKYPVCEIAKAMLEFGVDPSIKDADGDDSDDSEAYATKLTDVTRREEMVKLCKEKKEESGCFRMPSKDGGSVLYFFDDDLLIHTSKTCHVTRVTNLKTNKKCVLKFMREREQYATEIRMRQLGGADGEQQLSASCVVQILERHVFTPQELQQRADSCASRTPKATAIRDFGCHVVVMERGERDLADIIAHDLIAGVDLTKVQSIGRSLAECLHTLEQHKRTHGDTKPRNAMEFRQDDDGLAIQTIDLDASAHHGELAGLKWSSAFAPPELAALIYEYEYEPLPQAKRAPWTQYLQELPTEKQVRASATFDVWSFGMVMYSLASYEGAMPFLVSATDNIVRPEELRQLAYVWEEHKLTEVSKLVWPVAQDLVMWCLQTDPSRRPQSFADVLKHPFFNPEIHQPLRFLSGIDDSHCMVDLSAATVRHAFQLHLAIQQDDPDTVRKLFQAGSVHYNLCLQGSDLTDAQKSVTPLIRAARYGRLEIMKIVLEEIHPQAVADVIDTQTKYDHTALHWACTYAHPEVAKELIQRKCSTAVVNHRGKTAWDLAEQLFLLHPAVVAHASEVRRQLRIFATDEYIGNHDEDIAEIIGIPSSELQDGVIDVWTVLKVFIDLASVSSGGAVHAELQREQARRALRPEVKDTFRDDIEIDSARLDFWSVEPFDLWTEVAEGGYGKVFGAAADPDIEVAGRRFRRIAVKVPKPEGVPELTGEVKSLSGLSHPNVVQILGMCFGKTKGSDENHWMAQLEYCSTDLDHLLHGKDAALREEYTPQLMVKLIREMIAGLCYCHGMGKCHLDLKPDNILLAEISSAAGPTWTAKLADFGALVSETPTASAVGDEQHGGSTQTAQWLGTYLWMPPEATGMNVEKDYPKGRICAEPDQHTFGASDWFSFGIMLWEMVTHQLPNEGMGEAFQGDLIDKVWVRANGQEDRTIKHGQSTSGGGQWKEDFRAVAKAYFHGNRPEIPGDCPPLLSKLMVACWQDKQQDRPTSSFMRRLSELLPDEQWLKAPAQELSYDEFLGQLGLADKKDELAEYLSQPGAEL
eukprot:COSAG06_NODE_1989_length_7901_cov_61.871203_6_plen_1247_part_01